MATRWKHICVFTVIILSVLIASTSLRLYHDYPASSTSWIIFNVVFLAASVISSVCLLDIASYDPASSFNIRQIAFQYFVLLVFRTAGCLYYQKVKKTLSDCRNAQTKTLLKILTDNRDTAFGRDHQFEKIKTREEYRKCMPLTSYEYFRPYIDRIAEGEQNVLTSSKVVFLALTSGTTGKHKMFPMTERHKKDSMIRNLGNLYPCRDLIFGMKRSFDFRLFPPVRHSSGGIPMGGATVHVFTHTPASLLPPSYVKVTQEAPAFLVQAVFALREKEIESLNAFSSNLLYSFFKYCEANWASLCDHIEEGCLPADADIPEDIRQELNAQLTPSRERASVLRRALAQGGAVGLMKRIWPYMRFAIAPKTGGFALAARRLQETYLKGVMYFYMGHGASEGTFGFNLEDDLTTEVYTSVADSCFLEFIPLDQVDLQQPDTLCMEEVEVGSQYELVVTSPDGLSRYRLGDVIEIVGHTLSTPKYRFLYRMGQTLDLVGDKTPESLVYEALQEACSGPHANILVDYTSTESLALEHLLDCDTCYVLFVELMPGSQGQQVISGEQVDRLLCERHEPYKVYRNKGSIRPLMLLTVREGTFEGLRSRLCGGYQNAQFKMPRVLRREDLLEYLCDMKQDLL